jgi:hypothetical protein
MLVPDYLRKIVVFIGIKKSGRFLPRATGFVVSHYEDDGHFDYLVTAEHVVSGLQTEGHKIFLRFNTKDGKSGEVEVPSESWVFHPESEIEATDVAVAPLCIEGESEIRRLPLNHPSDSSVLATIESLEKDGVKIGEGSEVFILGLFKNHFGEDRNIPIIRMGNIAAMKGEPVPSKYCGYIQAHLIEARSIAGLSGSPVFVRNPPISMVDGKTTSFKGKDWYLFGLVHGHFDVKNLNEDVVTDSDTALGSIHTGIGVVVPIEKILETILHPDLAHERKNLSSEHQQKSKSAAAATFSPPNADPAH